MVEFAGFRTDLTHEYAGIIDEHVHEHLQDLEPFREYAAAIRALLD